MVSVRDAFKRWRLAFIYGCEGFMERLMWLVLWPLVILTDLYQQIKGYFREPSEREIREFLREIKEGKV